MNGYGVETHGKGGKVKEWASLAFAVAGVVCAALVSLVGKIWGADVTAAAYLLFVGLEVAAISIGIIMRRSGVSRGGIVVSVAFLIGSLLLLG